jgi:hypothetical protein
MMFQEFGKKDSPARSEAFKKMTPQQRLKKIDERELCKLCYRHLQGRECWSLGRVPNCKVDVARLLTIPYCTRPLLACVPRGSP